jgi:hypothetical protein
MRAAGTPADDDSQALGRKDTTPRGGRLLHRDLHATLSARWGDARAKMLTGPARDSARAPALGSACPGPPDGLPAAHADRLDGAWWAQA